MKDHERIAAEFHATYERLAPDFSYETRRASAVPWEQVPERNRALMVATVGALLDRGVIVAGDVDDRVRAARALEGDDEL